ncbi:hypothetical protein EFM21_07710 [Leuconostoc falkenbergense]|nr:hypothetical protein [Leuconostoc falkenbergense]
MAFASIKEINSSARIPNLLNIICALILLIACFQKIDWFKSTAVIVLVVFQLTAITNGLKNKSFHFQHHIFRLILTAILIFFVFLT